MLTQDQIKDIFDYKDGKLYWKIQAGRRSIVGEEAGCQHGDGYIKVTYDKVQYLAHRLIWVMFNGELPSNKDLTFLNKDNRDSHIENLSLQVGAVYGV